MTLPKFKELEFFSTISDIDQEIFLQKKNLFELKIQKKTNKQIKTHLFSHIKRRIAQLNLKKTDSLSQTKLSKIID
jgi:ribosomal protein L29